jgi:hypothetical protein
MSISYSRQKMPASRTDLALKQFMANRAVIRKFSEEVSGNSQNMLYRYNDGVDANVPLTIFHKRTARAGTLRTDIGFKSPYLKVNSISGESVPTVERQFGMWFLQPTGLLELTAADLQADAEFGFSLLYTGATSGVTDLATYAVILGGGSIFP